MSLICLRISINRWVLFNVMLAILRMESGLGNLWLTILFVFVSWIVAVTEERKNVWICMIIVWRILTTIRMLVVSLCPFIVFVAMKGKDGVVFSLILRVFLPSLYQLFRFRDFQLLFIVLLALVLIFFRILVLSTSVFFKHRTMNLITEWEMMMLISYWRLFVLWLLFDLVVHEGDNGVKVHHLVDELDPHHFPSCGSSPRSIHILQLPWMPSLPSPSHMSRVFYPFLWRVRSDHNFRLRFIRWMMPLSRLLLLLLLPMLVMHVVELRWVEVEQAVCIRLHHHLIRIAY